MITSPTAAIYARISRDTEGLQAGVDRQQEDCRTLAARHDYRIAATYIDNDISASKFSRAARPQYQNMMAAARRGEFEVIVAYSNSRLTRRMLELEDLIQLHEQHGTQIVTVVSGQDNLSTADGRMVARIKASVDAGEAERAGERIRRAHLQRARNGTTNHGGRPFGWGIDKLTPDPVEAQRIQDAAQQVLAGVSLHVIAAEWNRANILTSRGNKWTHTTVRRLLERPRMVGWRTHRGAIIHDSSGRPVRGEWVPLLDQDTFDQLQAWFARDGRSRRSGARRYLLTGTARCKVCGARMYGTQTRTGYAYQCAVESSSHTVTVTGAPTDDAVAEAVKARLAWLDLSATAQTVGQDFVGDDRLEQIPDLVAELMTAFNAGQLSGSVVFPQVEQLENEQAELRSERAKHVEDAAVSMPANVDNFDTLNVDRQRAVVEAVVDAVVVAPASRRGEQWSTDRLNIVWKT